jgi:ATP-dependent Lon protease
MTIFPLTVAPLSVGQPRSMRLIDDAMTANRMFAAVTSTKRDTEQPGPDDLYRVGTAATILQMVRTPDGVVRLAVQGVERIRILEYTSTEPYLLARVEPWPDRNAPGMEGEALRRSLVDLLRRLAGVVPGMPQELIAAAEALEEPRELAYLVASTTPLPFEGRQRVLEADPSEAKLRVLIELIQHEVAVRELGQSITSQTQERLTKAQRQMLLREQLRSIQQELDEGGEGSELDELRRKITEAGLPAEAQREATRELDRLAAIPEASPEHGLIRSWLEWMADLPWAKLTGGDIDVLRAREVLDEDHYDLDEVKERILESLAVRKLRRERAVPPSEALPPPDDVGVVPEPRPLGDVESEGINAPAPAPVTPDQEALREPILCFVGPPGVGKTSLGQSIARALGRKFIRMSLGGVRDEAEIRGHRRTYIGALPGRIVQGIRRVETRDPVFMLDEIDKVGSDWRGDPTSALLEVLDPAQNSTFGDNYLGVPFDLSQVLFIATANMLDTIPAPLLDRMEILRIAGYTEDEKVKIAQQYLVPQQRAAHGLTEDELQIEEDAIRAIAAGYTREAGVRELDRRIAAVCRKVARKVAERSGDADEAVARLRVGAADLKEYLGRPRFLDEIAERTDRPGVATGLAWTPAGGEILFVEAAMVPNDEGLPLILTGQLGDVMRESAQAALTYVQSEGERFGIPLEAFRGRRVHIHVPAGGLPKDGPSAGVAITTAITSLALRRPVRQNVAMTGEITLRGKVLPVGGIKEKVLAAHRAGIRTIILPRRNEPDLDDVPENLRAELKFVLADQAEDVLREALGIEVAAPAQTA